MSVALRRSLTLLRPLLQRPSSFSTRACLRPLATRSTVGPVRVLAKNFHTTAVRSGTVVPFKLSDIGEGIAEVTIKEWYVEVGDEVAQFDNICEVQSDKATVTITCRYDGVIKAVHFETEDLCRVGQALVDIEIEDDDSAPPPTPADPVLQPPSSPTPTQPIPPTPAVVVAPVVTTEKREILTTPAVRKMAADNRIDLSLVPATGKGGRITKDDLLQFISSGSSASTSQVKVVEQQQPVTTIPTAQIWNNTLSSQPSEQSGKDVTHEIKGITKVMVKTMTAAQQVPRFTFHDEYTVNSLIEMKAMLKKVGQEQKVKLTFMPFIIKACSQALVEFPMINAHVNADCTAITYKAAHNIGVATDTPHGLMVPNIKNVQNLSIIDIARELERLKVLSENNKLSTDDVTGGTFSLSNVGAVGGTYASPMLVVPEVCIGAFGKIQTKPAFNSNGEVYAASTMCISWSGDHRVLDGATVARYSNLLRSYLEDPTRLLLLLK